MISKVCYLIFNRTRFYVVALQKVATPGGSGPLIIQQQQQQQTLQKAMVQQIQDLLKQQHRQQGGATIQQVIATAPQPGGAVLGTTQLVSGQLVKGPAAATVGSVLSQTRAVTPIVVTAVPPGGSSATSQAMTTGTVNITLAAPSSGAETLLKDAQEVLATPQKSVATVVGGVANSKTIHAVGLPQQQAVTVRHIPGAALAAGTVAQSVTPQHTIIKQQGVMGKQSTIVAGQQVALRQAVQPSQLAAAIIRQHAVSVQQPQTVTVQQSPSGATTATPRPVSISLQPGVRPTVRPMAPVVSIQQQVRPTGTAGVQHIQTVRPPHAVVALQKSQTAAMQQVLQEVQQQAQAQAQQRHQVVSDGTTTVPQSPTLVAVSQASAETSTDGAAASTTAQQQAGNKSYAMRLRNPRSSQ